MAGTKTAGGTIPPNIKHLMDTLHIDETEARQLATDDERIEQGEKLFELNAEQKKTAKKMTTCGRKKTAYQFQKREKKENNEKISLINMLIAAIGAENTEIINPEREFLFTYNEKKYKITLSCPRK